MNEIEIAYYLSNGANGGRRAEPFYDEDSAVEAAELLGGDPRVSDVRFKGDDEFVGAASAAYYDARDARDTRTDNDIRANAARKALQAMPGYDDKEGDANVVDLLADLMHFCRRAGYDYDACARMARTHFEAEA